MQDNATAFGRPDERAVPFTRNFLASAAFRAMFREGMLLVEETAGYLDGQGRLDSRELPRNVSLAYATESMRLTTRLMQIASWLLVQRAVSEGEITPEQARTEKNHVRLSDSPSTLSEAEAALLPARLRELMAGSLRMQARVLHIDRAMAAARAAEAAGQSGEGAPVVVMPPAAANPVSSQLALLNAAFGPNAA